MKKKTPKLEEMPETCQTCRFFHLDAQKDEAGFCRRFPPVFVPGDEEAEGGWSFAVTWFDGWCGEHKGKCQ